MDPNRLTQKSQEALTEAQTLAQRLGHTEVDGEHLLVALLNQPDGLVPRLIEPRRASPDDCCRASRPSCPGAPKSTGPGTAPGQVFVTQRLSQLLDTADSEARRLKDEYVSVEHLALALIEEGSKSAAGRALQIGSVTRDAFLGALTTVRGNQRVTSATPEGSYEALEKYGQDLVADARTGASIPSSGGTARSAASSRSCLGRPRTTRS